uniref:Endonuclease/exonuclease/phosphatase domain-containing protein n=1 Tax=Neolamprologus brichardi TaxID=32507 RepID=A0A3Q4GNW3_NEOBR
MKQLLEVGFNLIICGDFNIVTEESDRVATTPFKINREGKFLAQVCADASLRDLYRILHPTKIHFTSFDTNSERHNESFGHISKTCHPSRNSRV